MKPPRTRVYFGYALQGYYINRGMWSGNEPQGELAALLNGAEPQIDSTGGATFYLSLDQLRALQHHILHAPVEVQFASGQSRGQALRRLREAIEQLEFPRVAPGPHRGPAGGAPVTRAQARQASSGNRKVRASSSRAPVPFVSLQAPVGDPAKVRSFEEHVMKTLRDFVDFTQSSAYMDASETTRGDR